MPTLAFRFVSRVVVLVQTADSPSAEEWDSYLDGVLQHIDEIEACCVLTYGGSPDGSHRARAAKVWQKSRKQPPTAVLTDSMFARAVVNAMSWVAGTRIRAFPRLDREGAFDHLSLRPEERAAVSAALSSLQRSLGITE